MCVFCNGLWEDNRPFKHHSGRAVCFGEMVAVAMGVWSAMRGWVGVVCMAVLTACASVPEENLQAYDWELIAAHDRAGAVLTADEVPGQVPARLQFVGQHMVVLHLCNRVSARYERAGRHLRVALPMATKRACAPPALMAWEQQVLRQMPQWQSYEWLATGPSGMPHLVLYSSDGSRWEWRAVIKMQPGWDDVQEPRVP